MCISPPCYSRSRASNRRTARPYTVRGRPMWARALLSNIAREGERARTPLHAMSTSRKLLLNLLFGALILGHLYDIVRDEEHWPFSQYPMFNTVWRSPTFTHLRLRGVTQDGTEFPLDANQ